MAQSARKKAVEKLDRAYSKYIRIKDARYASDGLFYNECFSCGELCRINELDAGHYVSRRYEGVRWDDLNVHPQCHRCNRKPPYGLDGNLQMYALALVREYGEGVLEIIETRRKEGRLKKISTFEIEELAKEYRVKNRQIIKNSCKN